MLPALLFDVTSFMVNLVLVLFIVYYLVRLRAKEKTLEKKEEKIDTSYHQIVDDALSKERKILEDATTEASQIITNAQYVNTSSKQAVEHALSQLMHDVQNDAVAASEEFKKSYSASLQQIAHASLSDFQQVTKTLQTDLEQQIKTFHDTLLPGLQKELEAYKQSRMKQAETTITRVVQEVSQEVLNKSISFEDHQKLLTDSLEKAKKEGIFD
jgi:F0F1-type ATP synthase membrane subunit b/b'